MAKNDQNQNKGGKDLLRDNRAGWDFLKNLVEMKANDVGRWAGNQEVVRTKILASLNDFFGISATSDFAMPFISTLLQDNKVLNGVIDGAGLDKEQAGLLKQALGDTVEGLRQYNRENGRLPESAARKILGESSKSTDRLIASVTYEQCFNALESDEQVKFTEFVETKFGSDRKKKFEEYKVKAIRGPEDLRALLRLQPEQWVPHLEQKIEKQGGGTGQKSKIESAFDSLVGFVTGAVKKIGDPISPDEQRHIDARDQKLKDLEDEIDDDIDKMSW